MAASVSSGSRPTVKAHGPSCSTAATLNTRCEAERFHSLASPPGGVFVHAVKRETPPGKGRVVVTTPARPICHRNLHARHRGAYVPAEVSGLVVVVMCSILERGAKLSPWRPQ